MSNQFSRTELLLGKDGIEKIKKIKVAIFGIGGVVTYKNAKELKRIVENLELSKIVLETDAPYLSPTPFRGKTNIPSYIKYVAKEVALLKEESLSVIEDITYKNACDFFEVNYEN